MYLTVMCTRCLPAVGRAAAGAAEDNPGQEAYSGAHQSQQRPETQGEAACSQASQPQEEH